MKNYVLTADGEDDIDLIKTHLLGEGGPRLVRYVLQHIQRGMHLIGGMPGIGHYRHDLTGDPVKFWQVFSYLIVYDPVPRPVHILRVLHSARDIAAILSRSPNA